jgi:hypothetical protein
MGAFQFYGVELSLLDLDVPALRKLVTPALMVFVHHPTGVFVHHLLL